MVAKTRPHIMCNFKLLKTLAFWSCIVTNDYVIMKQDMQKKCFV